MSSIVEADYRVVQEHTLPVIASEILFIESQVARTALEGAIQIGLKLKEAKEQVEHGQWENWCHENLNYSKSKTEKLMRIASEYGDENSIYAKTYTCTDLSISKALSLLQVPEEEADQMRKEAEQAAAERLSEAESLNTELAEKLDHLKKKLESRTDESLLLFKLKSDQLQEVFRECLQAADEAGNPKLKQALKGLMQKLTGGIDE